MFVFCQLRYGVGKQLPSYPFGNSGIDKQLLTAPIKSATDKFQLLPEFLKVVSSLCSMDYRMIYDIIINTYD